MKYINTLTAIVPRSAQLIFTYFWAARRHCAGVGPIHIFPDFFLINLSKKLRSILFWKASPRRSFQYRIDLHWVLYWLGMAIRGQERLYNRSNTLYSDLPLSSILLSQNESRHFVRAWWASMNTCMWSLSVIASHERAHPPCKQTRWPRTHPMLKQTAFLGTEYAIVDGIDRGFFCCDTNGGAVTITRSTVHAHACAKSSIFAVFPGNINKMWVILLAANVLRNWVEKKNA